MGSKVKICSRCGETGHNAGNKRCPGLVGDDDVGFGLVGPWLTSELGKYYDRLENLEQRRAFWREFTGPSGEPEFGVDGIIEIDAAVCRGHVNWARTRFLAPMKLPVIVLRHLLGELALCDHHHAELQGILQERWDEFQEETQGRNPG
jgi:hypothetical protein